MKSADISTAIKERLSGGMVIPGVWPNVDDDPLVPVSPPYFDLQWAARDREGGGLTGDGSVQEQGRVQITIAVSAGSSEDEALELADDAAALLPKALTIEFEGGSLTIVGQPDVRPGYRDGAEYRVPVLVRYLAIST